MSKNKIVLIISLFLILLFSFSTNTFSLTIEQFRLIGVIIVSLLCLIFEIFPIVVTCLLTSALLFLLKIVPTFSEALSGYTNHILYFTIASFGISFALSKTSIPKRLLIKLIGNKKVNIEKIILCFMVCTMILSSFVSNIAAVLVFIPFALDFLKIYEDDEHIKKSKKSLLITLTLASMIGGIITPAGSSINLITLDLIESKLGVAIPFVKWTIFGLPTAIVMLIVSYFICIKVYKPAELDKPKLKKYIKNISEKKKITSEEKYTLAVVIVTLILWILSSWIKEIHITAVAILALVLLFIPGEKIITYDEFKNNVSLPTFFIAGSMITLANAMMSTGLDKLISNVLYPSELNTHLIFMLMLVCLITFIFLIFVPVASAAVGILIPAVISFGTGLSTQSILLIALATSFCACNCYLLPLDTVMTIPYSYKAFKMFELPKATILIQLSMILLVSILFYLLSFIPLV